LFLEALRWVFVNEKVAHRLVDVRHEVIVQYHLGEPIEVSLAPAAPVLTLLL
jgi:hypothetical protein